MSERGVLLPQLVAARAAECPDDVFLQQVDGPSMTWADLHDANLAWAAGYAKAGVTRDANVVTMLPNSFACYSAWLGLAWIGAVEVPTNASYRGEMLRYTIANSRAEIVVISELFVDRLREVIEDLPDVRTVVVPDATSAIDLPRETIDANGFFPAGPVGDLEGPALHDTACIIYTSGTTGPSKGVLVPWGQLYENTMSFSGEAPRTGAAYTFYPPFHVSGKNMLFGCAVRGTQIVMRDTFSISGFWDDIRRYGCVSTALALPMALMLLAQPPRDDDADNPLESVVVGPLSPEVPVFAERFGVEFRTGYGMSEIGNVLVSGTNPSNLKSCGRPRPGYELRIADEHGFPVGPGDVGELLVRADAPWRLNKGYFGMPETTAEAWRDGWFHTGDGFMVDEVGDFHFVDRFKDAIRRRGENISSFEVEAHVNQHPAVLESAAIGVPSEFGEDEVKVVVIPRPGEELQPEELIEYLIPRMPRFMVPRYVELVDELPRTPATQRVRKFELRTDPLNDRTWDREGAGIAVPR